MVYIIIASLALITCGIINAVRLRASVKYIVRQNTDLQNNNAGETKIWPRVILLLPALREGDLIGETLERFARIHYPKNKLKIVIVTTEKEFENNFAEERNTITVAQETIRQLNASHDLFVHVHYPHKQGTKADQLNYAIEKLKNILPDYFADTTYVGVYDADSVTPDNTLELLAKDAAANKFPNIYQQPTFYFNNYRDIPPNFPGLLAKSFSWLQSAFALYHEANLFITERESKKRLGKMEYCIGHGMFVRWPFLKRIGLFPSPLEDTRLGHIASCLGEKIKILPAFDNARVAIGVWRQIKQFSVWFTGEAFVAEDLKIARRIMPKIPSAGIRLAVYKIYRNIVWIVRAPLLWAITITLIATHNYLLALLVNLFYLYLPLATLYFNMPVIQTTVADNHRQKFYGDVPEAAGIILAAPIEFLIMSIGPSLGLYRFLMHRFFHKPLHLPKTERETDTPYETFANIYSHTSVPWQQEVINDFIKETRAGGSVACIDIGTGIGNNVPTILKYCDKVEAIDISEKALDTLREKYAENLDRIVVKKMDAHRLNYPPAVFDLVICTEVLEHCSRPREVLNECARITKPGGWIILSGPNYLNPAGIMKIIIETACPGKIWDAWGNHEAGIENFTTSFKIKKWAIGAGLDIVDERGGDLIRSWLPFLRRYYEVIDRCPALTIGKYWPFRMLMMNYFMLARKPVSN